MDLTHRFSVPAGVAEAWDAFNDLEGLAPCFPGATITSVDGDEFSGSVKIKLGPISLMYNGSGRYVERNDADRRVVIEARGKDKRGNGTATATVTASFAENGGQTDVEVLTDLVITGKPAQFGRGVISDVSDKLLDQFVSCVSGRFADGLGADGLGADGSRCRRSRCGRSRAVGEPGWSGFYSSTAGRGGHRADHRARGGAGRGGAGGGSGCDGGGCRRSRYVCRIPERSTALADLLCTSPAR